MTTTENSESQAKAQLVSIRELVAAWKTAGDEGDAKNDAEQAIHDDALSVQVRYGWITPGHTADMLKDGPAEFEILLCTGGPGVRIIGELDAHQQPERARIEHQDWGTPWTEYRLDAEEEEDVLTYCACFYFGD